MANKRKRAKSKVRAKVQATKKRRTPPTPPPKATKKRAAPPKVAKKRGAPKGALPPPIQEPRWRPWKAADWAKIGLPPPPEVVQPGESKSEARAKRRDLQLRAELVLAQQELAQTKARAKRAERAVAKSKAKVKGGKRRLSKADRSTLASAASLRGWVTRRQNAFDRLVTRRKLSDAKKKWWSERKARQTDALKQRPGETRRQWIERIMSMPEINWERDYRWIAEQTGIGEREVYTIGVSPGSYGVEVA